VPDIDPVNPLHPSWPSRPVNEEGKRRPAHDRMPVPPRKNQDEEEHPPDADDKRDRPRDDGHVDEYA
jgi:hypothetical protein